MNTQFQTLGPKMAAAVRGALRRNTQEGGEIRMDPATTQFVEAEAPPEEADAKATEAHVNAIKSVGWHYGA